MRRIWAVIGICLASLLGLCQPAQAEFNFDVPVPRTTIEVHVSLPNVDTNVQHYVDRYRPKGLEVSRRPQDYLAPDATRMSSDGPSNPAAIAVPTPTVAVAQLATGPDLPQPRNWPIMLHNGRRPDLGTAQLQREVQAYRATTSNEKTLVAVQGGGGMDFHADSITGEIGRLTVRATDRGSQGMIPVVTPNGLPQGVAWHSQEHSKKLELAYRLGRDTSVGIGYEQTDPSISTLSQGKTPLINDESASTTYSVGLTQQLGRDVTIGIMAASETTTSTVTVRDNFLRALPIYAEIKGGFRQAGALIDRIPGEAAALTRGQLDRDRVTAQAQVNANLAALPPAVRDAWLNTVQPQLNAQWDQIARGALANASREATIAQDRLRRGLSDLEGRFEGLIPKAITYTGSSRMDTVTVGAGWNLTKSLRLGINYQAGSIRGPGWKIPYQNAAASLEWQVNRHLSAGLNFQGTSPRLDVGYRTQDLSVGVSYWLHSYQALEVASRHQTSQLQLNISARF